MKKKEYGLFTSIGMIVGVVIGSGIFFKSDNILIATNGSIFLGVLVFCIAALGIIFGSLSIAELAARDSKAGGIITYAEKSYNKKIAGAFGWFHTFLYYPTLIAVVGWVSGVYFCILFGIEGNLFIETLIGFGLIVFLYLVNILSKMLGGYIQNISTIIKIIPLILIAIIGVFVGNINEIRVSDLVRNNSMLWISAIAPIAFSFDGWIVSTSMAHEIKDSKKNLPKALVVAPLFILAIYVLYFVGISMYLGPENIMALGDSHVDVVANKIFGPFGAKIIIMFVVISILGTVNGLIMGNIRMPYSLAIRNMIPKSNLLSKVNKKADMPIYSAILSLIISLGFLLIHYIIQKFNLMPNGDISEISITVNYVLYILLYFKVLKLGINNEIKGLWRGKINPILATVGSLIILVGGFSNPLFILYIFICLIVLISGYVYTTKNCKSR